MSDAVRRGRRLGLGLAGARPRALAVAAGLALAALPGGPPAASASAAGGVCVPSVLNRSSVLPGAPSRLICVCGPAS